jgi:hypothetical protein
MVSVMAEIADRTLVAKKVSPDESDVTETPLEKSGAIRQEFIRVLRLTGCNSNAELILSVCWTVHCVLIPAWRS